MQNHLRLSILGSLDANLASLLSTFLLQPDTHHLLKTPPDQRSSHAQILREEISDIESSIRSISAIDHQVKVLLESLRSRRSNLIHALQSPVHALPAELVKSIFEISMESNARDSRLQVAVILSHVCSAWRSIALRTPSLWCTAKVSDRIVFDEIVKRSNPLPLDLFIAWSPRLRQTSSGDAYNRQVPRLAAFEDKDMKRLSSLSVHGTSLFEHISIPEESSPSDLVYLELMGRYSVSSECIVPRTLQSPRILEFNSWHHPPISNTIKGVWPRLKQLNLRDCLPYVVSASLNAIEAPLLERLEFHAMGHFAMAGFNFSPRPGVRSICMSDSAKFAGQFRRWMSNFPALESLELHLTASDMSSGWWKLVSP
ncbi:hypothetical protein DL93DRAFT_1806376 [Clavulina sp. PMI_390]|nr:hypothetical protein DL93DRAFT_1806376 [Clavulina sp. PMI_390]